MPSSLDLQYALFANNAYSQSSAVVSPENTTPIPAGWTQIAEKSEPDGFLARAYKNSAGEIVIAYGGTTFEGKGLAALRDWFTGNIAGTGLVLAPQVIDAAKFYLDLRANPSYQTAPLRFTGHSLGGGLAALMAVFFNEQATVFDEAPFRKSADSSWVVSRLRTTLQNQNYVLPAAFSGYSALDPTGAVFASPTREARQNNVNSVYLKGEVLSLLQTPEGRAALVATGTLLNWVALLAAVNVAPITPLGRTVPVDPKAISGNKWGWVPPFAGDPIDLHSMSLLTAFMQSPQLEPASQAHPELLQKLFTSPFNFDRNSGNNNIVDLFLQRQFADEGAWDVVAGDVQRLTGALNTGPLAAALVSLDLGMNYGQGIDRSLGASAPFEHMFRELVGGLQFTLRPEHSRFTSDGLRQLNDALGLLYPAVDRFIISSERYSLQSSGNLVASANADAKFDLMLGGSGADQLSSGDGWDRLFGLDGADTLEAGAGNDTLVGGAGDDVLNGGAGLDYYYRRAGDGNDTIIEQREGGILGGRIFLVSDAADTPVAGLFLQQGTAEVWNAASGGMTLTHGASWTLTLADGSTLDLGADIQNGDFGIYLSNAPQPITTDRTIVGDLTPVDFDPGTPGIQTQLDDLGNVITDPAQPQPGRVDTLFDSAGNDLIQAFAGDDVINAFRGGNDKLDGGAGRDIVSGRAGDDIVIGGSEGDLLRGDAGKDKIYGDSEVTVEAAIAAQDAPGTGLRGDFIDGGTEDDVLVAGADNDALNGGAGADLIITGGGDDDVDGDLETSIVSLGWSVTREVIDLGDITLYNRVYNGVGFLSTSPGGDDVVYGGAGADWLFTREGNDWIDGGAGDDVAFGEAGADEIFGGFGNDKLFGDSASVPLAQHGDDLIDGEDGDDEMNGDGGNDVLFGGEGNDEMFGDSDLVGGTDYLDGEGGDDVILGVANADIIFGGDGADFLQGDSGTGIGDGDDFIAGEAGNDIIFGEGGDDELDGGDGDDIQISGNAGSDAISGGAGNDLITGDDGDGINGDADTIDGGEGDDVALGDGGDDFIAGGAGIDQLQGGEGNDTIDGGNDGDVLFGEGGDDTLLGGGAGDQLIGGMGDDVLAGGDGDDVYFYSSGDGRDRISDSGGVDFLVFNNFLLGNLRLDVGSLKIVLPDGGEVHLDDFDPDNPLAGSIEFFQFADFSVFTHAQLVQALGFHVQGTPGDDALSGTALGESIQAFGGHDVVLGRAGNDSLDLGAGDDFGDGGDGNDTILGGDGHDLLQGGAGIDLLVGGPGDDRLGGGPGNDFTLDGGLGNDTYLFGTGDGQDVAHDAQGVNGVQLLGGLTAEQVTLQRAGNDLLILVNSTADRFTAREWFSNPAAWNQLGLGDGSVLDRAGVQARLVHNQAPILAPDTASTFEDNFVAVSGNALANDFDPEGRALSVTNPGTRIGTYGTLTLQSNGAFAYTVDNGREGVQSLAEGQTVSDSFGYTASDNDPAGAASASSTITVNVAGRNDAPVASMDFGFVMEDTFTDTIGNVLINDSDIDAGSVLHVVAPGNFEGAYGSLNLGVDGSYTYTLRNSSTAVQSLGQFVEATDDFVYFASDGILQASATLQLIVLGNNDAPVLAIPLADQTAVAGRSFGYAVPQGSFTDIDVGDVLSYSASLLDGFELPAWLSFDPSTQTFTGTAPSDATGFIDVEVRATDGRTGGGVGGASVELEFGDGEEGGESSASDVFRITFATHGGGGGGGGGGQGNEGVGNGEDPPPPGHDENFNDGPGTSPGNPGAKGGNGLGHSMPTLLVSSVHAEKRQVQSAAAWRQLGAEHPGNEGNHGSGQQAPSGVELTAVDTPVPPAEQLSTLSGDSGQASTEAPAAEGYDPVAARLSQEPYYDFEALLAWFAQGGGQGESLDPEEIRRRWARVAAANYGAAQDEAARGAPLGWQRLAAALAAGSAAGLPASGQFTGLTGGLPALDTFSGLNEGLQHL